MAHNEFNPVVYGCPRPNECLNNGSCLSAQAEVNASMQWTDVELMTVEQLETELHILNSTYLRYRCGHPDLTSALADKQGRIRIIQETIHEQTQDNTIKSLLDDLDIDF